jgi:hypothetical protein
VATAAMVREWAAAEGMGAQRGTLRGAVIEAWDNAHPDDHYHKGPPRDGFISDEEMDDMFPDVPDTEMEETRPRQPPKARTRAKPARGWNPFGGGKQAGKAKKKVPRVSVEDLLGGAWRAAAKLATPLPPLHRTLRIQAPVAGMLLEDAVKETAFDGFLQPFARMARAGRAINALLGPPLFVTAITVHGQQRASQGLEPNPIVMAMMGEGLRSSLIALMSVGEEKFIEAARREAEIEERFGGDMDMIIGFLFSPPPASPAEFEQQEAVLRRIVNPEAEPASAM